MKLTSQQVIDLFVEAHWVMQEKKCMLNQAVYFVGKAKYPDVKWDYNLTSPMNNELNRIIRILSLVIDERANDTLAGNLKNSISKWV